MPSRSSLSPGEEVGTKSHVAGRAGKSIEQIYQKKSQLEHILLRPDTYVGSCEPQMQEMWVFDTQNEKMQFRKVTYVPALYKIFDEILVNAADHLQRSSKMNCISVDINPEAGTIAVYNNGDGVPVKMHKEHKIYVPELIFGNLLTSDNYDDNEKKVTGGRNGFGAKLTNVFSTKFIVETADANEGKLFTQVMEQNMTVKNKPTIVNYKKEPFTRITFQPDLERFSMTELDTDTVALFHKRVWDIAATTDKKCKVYLNNKLLPVKDFKGYVDFFVNCVSRGEEAEGRQSLQVIHEKCGARWEVCATLSTEGQFQQVSFVNSINTIKGGTHVAHVADQLVDALLKKAQAGNKKGIQIKPANVKQHLWIFVNCLIENPAFDSQTKETLKTQQGKFGSKCELSETFLKSVQKSGVIDMILNWAKAKEKVDLGRKMKASGNQMRVLGVPKLEDANEAGGKKSAQCTLILTEGDSAKALAVAGLSVIGRDYYGVFPLRGKVLNVREAAHKTLMGNSEIQAILKIVGLTPNQTYEDLNKLRYGSIMIMTDQDLDGSHIKGLLINMIENWWPSLMQHKGFLKEFVTPIVKVHKGGKFEKKFYTIADYESWRKQHNNGKGWDTKYYKGLGTSTAKEAKEYFRDIEINEICFTHDPTAREAIDLAFNKARADDRKDWMNNVRENDTVNHNIKTLAFSDFINKELIWFSKYAALRAIPNIMDGFKPGQRKIMFCAFKKKLKKDIKVAQFVGYVSEKGAYHHGEKSLEDTIVNMAQDFVGSNNLNLFFPSGQFGTRLAGGSDHASARYIFTRLMPYTRNIFNELDDNVLAYHNEEGQWIEPHFYVPILPMVLVNGAAGIGVGWSTSIPNFNPLEIIDNLRRYLRKQPMTEMVPWYRGFIGDVAASGQEAGKYLANGIIRKVSETQLEILELPIKEWTSNYKEFLEAMLPGAAKAAEKAAANEKQAESKKPPTEPVITDMREHHTENTVHFILKLTEEQMARIEAQGMENVFKLRTSLATTNMMLFDVHNKIKRYETANDILDEFAITRLEFYDKRKRFLIDKLGREKLILDAKVKFILMILSNQLEIRNKRKKVIIDELLSHGFQRMSEIQKGNLGTLPEEEQEGGNKDGEDEDTADPSASAGKTDDFNYLLGMPLWNLTQEKVEELQKQLKDKKHELSIIQNTSREQMWDKDLSDLRTQIEEDWAKQEKEEEDAKKVRANNKKKAEAKEAAGKAKRGKKAAAWADDEDDASQFAPRMADFKELKKAKQKPAPIMDIPVQGIDLEEKREYMKTRQVEDRVAKRPGKRALAAAGGLTQGGTQSVALSQAADETTEADGPHKAMKTAARGKKKIGPPGLASVKESASLQEDDRPGAMKQQKITAFFGMEPAAAPSPGAVEQPPPEPKSTAGLLERLLAQKRVRSAALNAAGIDLNRTSSSVLASRPGGLSGFGSSSSSSSVFGGGGGLHLGAGASSSSTGGYTSFADRFAAINRAAAGASSSSSIGTSFLGAGVAPGAISGETATAAAAVPSSSRVSAEPDGDVGVTSVSIQQAADAPPVKKTTMGMKRKQTEGASSTGSKESKKPKSSTGSK
ncbi:unnamed protein product [Amoebophrya sp. A25]|nr:unnamed protein product [Amoebophrya sp. A25]|eukprot:GSA25T00013424001.1